MKTLRWTHCKRNADARKKTSKYFAYKIFYENLWGLSLSTETPMMKRVKTEQRNQMNAPNKNKIETSKFCI